MRASCREPNGITRLQGEVILGSHLWRATNPSTSAHAFLRLIWSANCCRAPRAYTPSPDRPRAGSFRLRCPLRQRPEPRRRLSTGDAAQGDPLHLQPGHPQRGLPLGVVSSRGIGRACREHVMAADRMACRRRRSAQVLPVDAARRHCPERLGGPGAYALAH